MAWILWLYVLIRRIIPVFTERTAFHNIAVKLDMYHHNIDHLLPTEQFSKTAFDLTTNTSDSIWNFRYKRLCGWTNLFSCFNNLWTNCCACHLTNSTAYKVTYSCTYRTKYCSNSRSYLLPYFSASLSSFAFYYRSESCNTCVCDILKSLSKSDFTVWDFTEYLFDEKLLFNLLVSGSDIFL